MVVRQRSPRNCQISVKLAEHASSIVLFHWVYRYPFCNAKRSRVIFRALLVEDE